MSSIILLSNYDIENATKGLSDSLKIGQGGYGAVYRGYFGNTEVAIKMLDANSQQGIVEFLQELEVLGRLKHPHLVKIIGACVKLRSLVYEFLPNGSLGDCLRKNPRLLTWQMRTRIVYQICSALIFLHANKPEPVVHRDLKPENILLDADFNSKLTDFGLCRFIPEGTTTTNVLLDTNPKGTIGYTDPEFMKTGYLKPDWDVYSFGVTILRLLTGTDALGINVKVRKACKEKSLMTMVDQTAGNWPADVSKSLAYFGLRCCARNKSPGLLNEIARDLVVINDQLAANKVSSSSQESYGDKLPESLQHSTSEDIPEAMLYPTTSSEGRRSNEMSSIILLSNYEIENATKGLSNSLKIGQGRYGPVYKGYFRNTEIAIKMLDANSQLGTVEFLRELEVLGRLKHPHLVNLIGACFKLRSLVYEFLPNGSLGDCLWKNPRLLTWQMRTRIVYQICSALIFLHANKPEPVVHGDLKPWNILLDADFNSKLADFGLCPFIPEGTTTVAFLDTGPIGTFGYIDPEFMKTGILTPGGDVYSFGVTILRLLTGTDALGISAKVRKACKEKSLMTMVDQTDGNWPADVSNSLAYFGLRCCAPNKSSGLLNEIARDLVVINDQLEANKLFTEDNEETKGEGSGISSNLSDRTSRFKSFTNLEIESATDGLSKSSKIGKGGYGSVYKGHLDNAEVAIKMLDANSSQGSPEFLQEVDFLGDIRHPHIVRLIGACFNLRALVYEFLPSGSIEDCLKDRPNVLTWQMRTRIIHEICTALIFLHSRKPKPIVHGDLKPDNILLDSNFTIKIADFGLSRFMSEGTSTTATAAFHQTKNIKGTDWYIDPDFLETGKLTPGCDVYAFGITILRILTGAPPAKIIKKVKRAIKGETLMTIVDSAAGDWPDEVAEYLASIGLECCKPERRCSGLMLEISNGLKDILAEIGS